MHQEFEAPDILKDAVRCLWYDRSDLGAANASFDVTPDGYAEIIFHFGSGCSVMRQGTLQPIPSPFIMGLLNRTITFYT